MHLNSIIMCINIIYDLALVRHLFAVTNSFLLACLTNHGKRSTFRSDNSGQMHFSDYDSGFFHYAVISRGSRTPFT